MEFGIGCANTTKHRHTGRNFRGNSPKNGQHFGIKTKSSVLVSNNSQVVQNCEVMYFQSQCQKKFV